MRGTAKQIKWAEDIKTNIIKVYEAIKSNEPSNTASIDAAIAKLNAIDYAGTIIDLYKWCGLNGDIEHDASAIAANHRNMTAAERALVIPG